MILLVVGLVAVIVVVLIAVILSIRLGRNDGHDEPDPRSRGRDRRRVDEDEHWRGHDTRRAPSASARGVDPRGGRTGYPGYAERGTARDRGARTGTAGHRQPAAARSPVPASAPARGRYDTGPQRRPATDDFPPGDYPSMDFGPAGVAPSGEHPSVEFPAVGYDATDHPEDRPEPRRKAASANGKSRSRQRGKRDDDDDWPSTEWDKLSDEQYWAELSADKPLAAMARPSRTAGNTRATANGSAKRAAGPPAARTPAPARDLPSRAERTEPREPVTERLPVRTRQQPPAPRRPADTPRAGSYAAEPRSPRDTGPHPIWDTGPRPEPPRRSNAPAPNPARERDLAMLAGLASAPPPIRGALDDDPLTSPSFSLKADTAPDSRSYSSSRKHAKPHGQGVAPGHTAGNGADPADGTGYGSGSHPTAGYASAGYAYQAAPPATAAEQWYSAPPAPAGAQTSAYGNPYQHSGPGTAGSPAGGQAASGHGGYVADPLHVYSPLAYEAPRYAEPASPAHDADGHAQRPYPDRAAYPGGYEAGYPGDPYAGGGYRP